METPLRTILKKSQAAWLVLGLAILITLSPLLVGYFYATGDMRDMHIPLELFYQKELRAGRLPSWNPDIAWGFPVIAAGQIGFFYPPLLIGRLLAPVWVYLPTLLILHFAALAIGTYVFLRQQKLTNLAAILGSLTFSLSAWTFQHITHLNITLGIAYFPWQLLLAHQLSQNLKINLRQLAGLTLLLALPFVVGQFQVPFLMAAFTSLYFLFHFFRRHRAYHRPLIAIGALTMITLGLASLQILPTLELLKFSSRSDGGDFNLAQANQHSYPLYHLPTLLFPRFFGNDDTYWGKRLEIEYGFFIGTLPLVLLMWSLFKKNTRGNFWFWTFIVSFLLALGNLSPFRLIGLEPSLWFFSAPARWLFITTFAASVLVSQAFDNLAYHLRSFQRFAYWSVGFMISAVLLTNFFLFTQTELIRTAILKAAPEQTAFYEHKVDSLLMSVRGNSVSLTSPFTWLPLINLALLPLVISHRQYRRLIVTLTALELILIAATTSPLIPWKTVLHTPDTVQALPAAVKNKAARLWVTREGGDTGAYFTNPESRANAAIRATQERLLIPLLHAQHGLAGVEWPASLDLKTHNYLLNSLRPTDSYLITNLELLRSLNIGALLIPTSLEQPTVGKLIATSGGVNIYEIPAYARAFVVNDKNQEVSSAHVTYVSPSPSTLALTVTTDQPGYLIIQDTFFPGWTATQDNTPTTIEATENLFRKIPVPAGSHKINLSYQSPSILLGMGISLTTLLITLGLGSRSWKI